MKKTLIMLLLAVAPLSAQAQLLVSVDCLRGTVRGIHVDYDQLGGRFSDSERGGSFNVGPKYVLDLESSEIVLKSADHRQAIRLGTINGCPADVEGAVLMPIELAAGVSAEFIRRKSPVCYLNMGRLIGFGGDVWSRNSVDNLTIQSIDGAMKFTRKGYSPFRTLRECMNSK